MGKLIPTCFAMFFVFFVVGVWHGASAKYLLFGLHNGIIIGLGILFQPLMDKICDKIPGYTPENKIRRVLCNLRTLLFAFIGKHVVLGKNVPHVFALLRANFSGIFSLSSWLGLRSSLGSYKFGFTVMALLAPPLLTFLAVSVLQERGIRIRDSFAKRPLVLRWAVYYAAIFYMFVFGSIGATGGFIYAQF